MLWQVLRRPILEQLRLRVLFQTPLSVVEMHHLIGRYLLWIVLLRGPVEATVHADLRTYFRRLVLDLMLHLLPVQKLLRK